MLLSFLSRIKKSEFQYTFAVFFVLAAALILRLINLNYNSASIDEAIYVMIGRMGIFQNDWWSYNPSTWLAGLPYIYPPIAAITYVIGGITASRLFNIFLSLLLVITVIMLTWIIYRTKTFSKLAAASVIAASIVGFSSIGIVVSRLATYDVPSYYLFLLSLLFLLKAESRTLTNGKYYFLSALFMVMATLTKIIIGAYVPFLFIYSFFRARKISNSHYSFWLKYYLLPLVVCFFIYGITNYSPLLTYVLANTTREKEPISKVFLAMWQHTRYVWIFWSVASLVLIFKKFWHYWLLFTLLSVLVLLPHFLSQRAVWTMEKQTFLTISLLSPLIGIGLSEFIHFSQNKFYRVSALLIVFLSLFYYSHISFGETRKYALFWQDTRNMTHALQTNVFPGALVLSEAGPPYILDTYDYNYPLNVTTFDWFKYRNLTGYEAYVQAVRDGYFDVIQLNGGATTSTTVSELRGKILANMGSDYRLVFSQDNYLIFRRNF